MAYRPVGNLINEARPVILGATSKGQFCAIAANTDFDEIDNTLERNKDRQTDIGPGATALAPPIQRHPTLQQTKRDHEAAARSQLPASSQQSLEPRKRRNREWVQLAKDPSKAKLVQAVRKRQLLINLRTTRNSRTSETHTTQPPRPNTTPLQQRQWSNKNCRC